MAKLQEKRRVSRRVPCPGHRDAAGRRRGRWHSRRRGLPAAKRPWWLGSYARNARIAGCSRDSDRPAQACAGNRARDSCRRERRGRTGHCRNRQSRRQPQFRTPQNCCSCNDLRIISLSGAGKIG